VDGIILDLRGNSGGLLDEAVSIAGLFAPGIPVVQVRDGEGHNQILCSRGDPTNYDGPLIILVSRQSISASEILAGALQGCGRALVVGDKTTYGKGSVQAILPMSSSFFRNKNNTPLGTARITIQKWYLPNGESIQRRGVLADIPLPSFNDYLPLGEDEYDHPLPWDSIGPVCKNDENVKKFFTHPLNESVIQYLSKKSFQRRSSDNWKLWEEQIVHFKERMEQKEFSLQLEERRKQRMEDMEQRKRVKRYMKELREIAFPEENIFLDAVSRGDFGEKMQRHLLQQENGDFPEFDFHLQESLHIFMNWLVMEKIF
jgi:carboxyl-terminal processing protease